MIPSTRREAEIARAAFVRGQVSLAESIGWTPNLALMEVAAIREYPDPKEKE